MSNFVATPSAFPITRWSAVLAATRGSSTQAAEALETICRAYWYPLYAYARRHGVSPHDAQDLTQEFFHRLLEKRWLDAVDREKGRLRTFLVVALKRFMASERRRANAQRRGGSLVHVSLDTEFAENRYSNDPSTALSPDALFERHWALALLNLALDRLRSEFVAAGKNDEYTVLKDCLMKPRGTIDYASLGARLGISGGAVRVAVHRLRKRFRDIYREEVSQTLSQSEDLDSELHHLAAVLAKD